MFWIPDTWVPSLAFDKWFWSLFKKKKRELKKLFSPQSLPPLRRKTHHVIEIFSSFFFKLDTSLHIPFILSCSDSFKNCCFVDPEWPKGTGGLSTEAWREHTAPRRVVKPTSSPVFRHQVSTVVLSSPRILIYNWLFFVESWYPFHWLKLIYYFNSTCPVVIYSKATGPLEYISATVTWSVCIQVCKPNCVTWSASCRWFWLLSIYMDHGDIQKKNAFIFIGYFIELYKMGINKCIYSRISFLFA